MTPEEARQRLRSLRYRRRLQASTSKREAELMIFVWDSSGIRLAAGRPGRHRRLPRDLKGRQAHLGEAARASQPAAPAL